MPESSPSPQPANMQTLMSQLSSTPPNTMIKGSPTSGGPIGDGGPTGSNPGGGIQPV